MRYSLTSVATATSVAAIMLAATGCSSSSGRSVTAAPTTSTEAVLPTSSLPVRTPRVSTPATSAPAASSPGSPKASPSADVITESNPPGDIPDNQAFVPYTPAGAHFSVKVPEGWAAQQVGGATLFTDKLNAIQVSSGPTADAPSVPRAKSTTVPQLQSSEPRFTLKDVTAVMRKAGPVVLVHYERDSASNDVTGKVIREEVFRFEFFNAGTEVDVVLSGPTGADNVDPWRIVTDSLKWLA